jgi:hypothetical protein
MPASYPLRPAAALAGQSASRGESMMVDSRARCSVCIYPPSLAADAWDPFLWRGTPRPWRAYRDKSEISGRGFCARNFGSASVPSHAAAAGRPTARIEGIPSFRRNRVRYVGLCSPRNRYTLPHPSTAANQSVTSGNDVAATAVSPARLISIGPLSTFSRPGLG